MREALAHSSGAAEPAVLGVVSLVFWALTLIVTVKYVFLVLRADNKGEGGTLALMALAQYVIGRRTRLIFVLGVSGAALFYGDSLITPAISVLSAAEGILAAPGIGTGFQPYVLPTAGSFSSHSSWCKRGEQRVSDGISGRSWWCGSWSWRRSD